MSTSFNLDMAGAQETLAALRAKQIAARELVERTFQRLDKYNPIINAVVWQSRHDAMTRAGRADEVLARGDTLGPLHGLPITIKEAFAYRGSPNSWGLPPLKDVNSPRTAIAVERLEAAGAIVIGKTNTPVMLGDWQSDNPLYGTTNNPWDLSRTAGGSTGGGAAAVATGLGALALGSDLSGSIRIPAHFCGVYGHKPSLELGEPRRIPARPMGRIAGPTDRCLGGRNPGACGAGFDGGAVGPRRTHRDRREGVELAFASLATHTSQGLSNRLRDGRRERTGFERCAGGVRTRPGRAATCRRAVE